jgi:hypothetical protein
MTTYYGSSPIKAMTLSQSWGINPATAELVCVGTQAPALDEEMWLTIGGTTWFGRVKGYQTKTDESGVVTVLRLIDNRDKLMQSMIFAQFNMQDENGIWFHLFPGSSWAYQDKFYPGIYINGKLIWEPDPLTPNTIIGYILDGTGFGYQSTSAEVQTILNNHLSLCHGLDWNLGKKRGLALLEVCDKLGLSFAIDSDDPNLIIIGRKGATVNYLTGNFTSHAEGLERIFTDDLVTVVGEPNIYEITDAPLYPDWPSAWDFITGGDAALLALLRTINPSDPLSVTVEDMPNNYHDDETHAGYERNAMLAMDYAITIPYKVYKLNLGTAIILNGHASTYSDLMPIHERLVSDVDTQVKVQYTGYTSDPHRPLQPMGLVSDSKSGGYDVDRVNGKIIFRDRKFAGDFLVQVGDQYKIDFSSIVPDTPLLTFAVLRELFTSTGGTGSRAGSHHVRNLRKEYVVTTSGRITDTVDRGVESAEAYAHYIASLITSKPTSAVNGFVQREGQCGYKLAETFDRVTVTLDGISGIKENVTYATEQPQVGIPTEREMERRAKAATPETDLSKANAVWDAVNAAIADGKSVTASAQGAGGGNGEANVPPHDLPLMDPKGVITASNGVSTFSFGDVLCSNGIDGTTGQFNVKDPSSVANSDPSYMGVVVQDCTNSDYDVKLKSTGLVTVKVNGVVAEGDQLGPVAGEVYCEAGQTGTGVAKSTNGGGLGFVRAQLGAGSGEVAVTAEFFQVATPTPVSGKTNRWYKSGSGGDSAYAAHHYFVYSFGETEWIDQFGWA